MQKTSRSESTKENYENKARQLCQRVATEYGLPSPHQVSPLTVVDTLISRKSTISRNTWKYYKASLRYLFEKQMAENEDLATKEELFAAIELLTSESSSGAMKKGVASSAKKAKSVPEKDFQALVNFLSVNAENHKYAAILRTWILAARITGLRPSEWQHCGFIYDPEGNELLRVKNAKFTNGRGNGEYRTLNISGLQPHERQAIHDMIEMIDIVTNDIPFPELQSAVSDYMSYAVRKCLGHRKQYPSLYSLRHQFSADIKNQFSKQEVAALLGHASDETAGNHYAKARQKQSSVNVKPIESEVSTVRKISSTFTPRKSK